MLPSPPKTSQMDSERRAEERERGYEKAQFIYNLSTLAIAFCLYPVKALPSSQQNGRRSPSPSSPRSIILPQSVRVHPSAVQNPSSVHSPLARGLGDTLSTTASRPPTRAQYAQYPGNIRRLTAPAPPLSICLYAAPRQTRPPRETLHARHVYK